MHTLTQYCNLCAYTSFQTLQLLKETMTRGCNIPSVIHIVRRQGEERGLENSISAHEGVKANPLFRRQWSIRKWYPVAQRSKKVN